MLIETLKLCLVTQINDQPLKHYMNFLQEAIKGGISSVQFRDKNDSYSNKRDTAHALKIFLSFFNIPLIINDNVELAKEIDAAGVHLGQSDLHPLKARQLLGPDKIIGWSVETYHDLESANELDCIDYIAASAIFTSRSKPDCKTIWGLEGLQSITQTSKHPVVAIGGIDTSNIRQIIMHGAIGCAVISAIHDNSSPQIAASKLISEMNKGPEDVHAH